MPKETIWAASGLYPLMNTLFFEFLMYRRSLHSCFYFAYLAFNTQLFQLILAIKELKTPPSALTPSSLLISLSPPVVFRLDIQCTVNERGGRELSIILYSVCQSL